MNFLDKILNIKYSKNNNISLSKALLLFYIIVASNFTKNLYSGQLQDFFENNRLAQHMIGLITMLMVIVNVSGITDPTNIILYSTLCYIWFILTTKLDLQWNLAIVALLIFGYMYESKMVGKEKDSEDDPALEDTDKEKIKKNHTKMKTVIVISIMIITLLGTVQYFQKKHSQYGNDFDTTKFLFQECRRYKLVK